MKNKLSYYMAVNHMSDADMAKKLNYTPMAIYHYRHGRTLPNVIIALKIADILGVRVEEIWRLEENEVDYG